MRFRLLNTILFLLIFIAGYAKVSGEWVLHPSADLHSYTGISNGYNNCAKIISGERYTYFLVTSFAHTAPNQYYSATEWSLYRVDNETLKSDKGAIVESLNRDLPVSGMRVKCAEYSVAGKYLAVIYEDSALDIIYDDGRVVASTVLKDYRYPCDKTVNNVMPDLTGEKIYIATAFGYLSVSASEGRICSFNNLNADIDYVCPVGDKLILASNDTLYAISESNPPATLKDVTPLQCNPDLVPARYLNSDGYIRQPNSLMPLTDKTFIYLTHAAGNQLTGPYINVAELHEDGVRVMNISEATMNYAGYGYNNNGRYKYINQGIVTISQSGYIINTTEKVIHVRRGLPIDISSEESRSEFMKQAVTTIPKAGFGSLLTGTSEKLLPLGSFNGEDFCFFYPLQGFRHRQVALSDASAVWTSPGEPVDINASHAFRVSYMTYHPHYGVMLRNNSFDPFYDRYTHHADALCAYRDGVWTYYGLPKTNYAKRNTNPIPQGIGVDPIDPKYVWGGSREYGISRLNLDDPTDILRMTRSNMAGVGTGGDYAVHDYFKEWSSLSCFTPPAFDHEDRMWFHFTDWDKKGSDICYNLWYLTADERRKMESAATDRSAFVMPHRIEIPVFGVTTRSRVWPMKMEANKNLVGVTAGHYFDSAILDHNGTPEDTSDDKVIYLNDILSSANVPLTLTRGVFMYEDPYDGAILISYDEGVLVTSRHQLFESERKRGDLLEVEADVSGMLGHPIAQCPVTAIAVDDLHRKWIATVSDGLYCISEDRKTLLAHFTQEQVGLPSDVCLSCVYNPESRSIWVGTDKGVAEFVLAGGELPKYRTHRMRVSPGVIEPDYLGYVIISGLDDSREYILADSKGIEVMSARPQQGKISVHSAELTGGEYTVSSEGETIGKIIRNK